MKKFAEIVDNIVKNIGLFDDECILPDGWIDVTNVTCGIGWPLNVEGNPIPQPSPDHVVNAERTGWELAYVDESEKIEKENEVVKSTLSRIDQKSIRSMREFLVLKFGDDADFPSYLNTHENNAVNERSKLK